MPAHRSRANNVSRFSAASRIEDVVREAEKGTRKSSHPSEIRPHQVLSGDRICDVGLGRHELEARIPSSTTSKTISRLKRKHDLRVLPSPGELVRW